MGNAVPHASIERHSPGTTPPRGNHLKSLGTSPGSQTRSLPDGVADSRSTGAGTSISIDARRVKGRRARDRSCRMRGVLSGTASAGWVAPRSGLIFVVRFDGEPERY